MIGLTKATAAYYGSKGIRSLCIMPGPMETNIATDIMSRAHPEGINLAIKTMAMGAPFSPLNKVANVILSLCSEDLGPVNGACVPVDGGWTSF